MRLVSIASGSSGNCIYVGTDSTHILIDAGISTKRIEAGLAGLGIKGSELSGILITHEHSDHIGGLRVFSRKNEIPIYTTKETYEGILTARSVGGLPGGLHRKIFPDEAFFIGDMKITPFSIDHDAAGPCAFRVDAGASSAAVVTDLGNYSQYTINHLLGLDAILLEANHDVRMLETGPYPYYLKRRIMGNRGHLSNDSAGRLLGEILHDGFKKALLGHLSKENNFADLAYETVRLEITTGENAYQGTDFDIAVADRSSMSETIYL
ncbi:MAG: MBL fold metallo-hydrolase [Lachnospiraceae bacterium]|nr:MBL fold metallo-hydrolase [Lachnospiraceae bacterium]